MKTNKLDEIDLIIKRNTMGGSGKFDAKSAIPQLQALISTEVAKAKFEEASFWLDNVLPAVKDGLTQVVVEEHLANTESNKEGVEVNE